ncbi:MAG: dihydroneopterin aldolase [Anaerolineae bacterium]
MDQIHVEGLYLRTILGVTEEQRRAYQDVRIDLHLYTDTRWPSRSDRIEDAVDYHTITKRVIRLVEHSRFYLMEKLEAEIAAICLEDSRVERVRVRLEKPGALHLARCVAVEIERTRADLAPTMHRVFVTLRTSDETRTLLREAVERLHRNLTVLALSPIYRTASGGSGEHRRSFTAAALMETSMTPAQLRERLTEIEEAVSREARDDASLAVVDLTIALYDDAVLDLGTQRIPHPDILTQAPVAVPLADLAPAYHHPQTGLSLEEIADALAEAALEKTKFTL